jgi:fructose transport system substrate-binding protein
VGGFAIALLATVSAATILAGASTVAKAAGDEILIGLVTKTEVNPYFVKLREAATAEAQKQGRS